LNLLRGERQPVRVLIILAITCHQTREFFDHRANVHKRYSRSRPY